MPRATRWRSTIRRRRSAGSPVSSGPWAPVGPAGVLVMALTLGNAGVPGTGVDPGRAGLNGPGSAGRVQRVGCNDVRVNSPSSVKTTSPIGDGEVTWLVRVDRTSMPSVTEYQLSVVPVPFWLPLSVRSSR